MYLCSCISFDSYIKPQQSCFAVFSAAVVYLLIPTSNHNIGGRFCTRRTLYIFWFLHQTTTLTEYDLDKLRCISFDSYIKPQLPNGTETDIRVVYLLIPTSNHNRRGVVNSCKKLYIFWFLHQTTTFVFFYTWVSGLYIFWFLHQTTTVMVAMSLYISCISFDSYIKPQQTT